MSENQRKRSRNIKKRVLWIIVFVTCLIVALSSSYFVYSKNFKGPLFVSPIAGGGLFRPVKGENDDSTKIKKLLSEKKIEYQAVERSGNDYIIKMKDKGEVVLSGKKEMDSQISSLQFILTRLTMEGKSFTRLDLRFDKPVVRLNKI